MTFSYTDPDGFDLLISRETDEAGRPVLQIAVNNPPGPGGWTTGSCVQIPEEQLLAGIREVTGR